jgi:hypothetical protein
MGLYDRDYMRDKPAPEDEDEPGMDRLATRRRWLLWGGVIVILAGMIVMWVVK